MSGPDQIIVYLNRQAESLLGISCGEAVGLRCHQLIAARDEHGEPVCRSGCDLWRRAGAGEALLPTRLTVLGPDGEKRWLRVLPIRMTMDGAGGRCIAHCAMDDERAHRVESYLDHVAHRSGAVPSRPGESLTPREWQVLEMLAQDRTVREIAERMDVSYTTVRNHVQHLLRKLRLHSIAEAVAFRLLQGRP